MESGPGTYVYLGKIYSQHQGTMKIERNSGHSDIITVIPKIKENETEVDEFLGRVDSFAPETG